MGDKWTLLIIRDLASGARRFVELQRTLPGISTEQLRSRLNRMVADGLLTRQRYREVPPRVDYELTERAYELMPVIGALARWGYDWAWTPPREGEDLRLGAIFRTGPGMLAPPAGLSGTAELVVEGDRTYVMAAADGHVTVSEQPVESADVTVTGDHEAWVAALGPDGDVSKLDVAGDRALADFFVQGFATAAAARSAA